MRLSFDTLDELNAFVEWAGYQKRTKYALQQLLAESDCSESLVGCNGEVVAQQAAPSAEQSETAATTAPEGTKRRRCTKADIEAEKAVTPSAEWPFTSPACFNLDPRTFAATAPQTAEQLGVAPIIELNAAVAETLTVEDARSRIAQVAAKMGVVDAAKHLDQCRAFIQAHGMTAYASAGALVELTSSPVGFDDAQRALHSAALEYWATANPA